MAAVHDPTTADRSSAPDIPDSWLADAARHWPALQRAVRTVDRGIWGGAALVVGFVVVLVTAAAVGWVLSTVDTGTGFARWDESVAEWGSEHAGGAATGVLRAVTLLGASPILLTLMAIVGLAEWLRRGTPTSLGFLMAVGLGVLAVNNALKLAIMRERPPVDHLVSAAGSAFPSGHSSAAAACWLGLALVVSRWSGRRSWPWVASAAVAIAVAVAASRALLGVHWLTDVLAGLLVGWAWFTIVAVAFGRRLQPFGEPVERAADAVAHDPAPVDPVPVDSAERDGALRGW